MDAWEQGWTWLGEVRAMPLGVQLCVLGRRTVSRGANVDTGEAGRKQFAVGQQAKLGGDKEGGRSM